MAISAKMNGHGAQNAPERTKPTEDMDSSPLRVHQAKNIKEIKAAMEVLKERDESVTVKLNALLATQKEFSRELGRLDLLRGQLGTQAVATRSIGNNMLADTSVTARRISGAVRNLDLEQERVKATLQVVEQVAELKACVQGVTGSMEGPQDWETAAGYLQRASKIPQDIVRGSFAEEMVPSAEIPDPPQVTLQNAAESLCGLFVREFDKAVKEDNGAKVTRFFKLFPLIGRSDVGLDIYGKYVCQGVAAHARGNLNSGTGGAQSKEGYFYATALSKLFEYTASIVERHGGLVERHYGEGRMVRVIQRLQFEADTQGGIIVDTWTDERRIDRKITDIKSYAFTFLVHSFLPAPNARNTASRTASPAAFDRKSEAHDVQAEDPTDMKEVDALLNEMGMMLGRWSLYCRFTATKCAPPPPSSQTEPEPPLAMPELLENSALMRKVASRLIEPFNIMSAFYVRRSVERAFQLDEQPTDLTLNPNKKLPTEGPYVTSAVDDVMYIINQVIQRTVATSQREVIANTIPTIARILSSDFIGMCQRKMRDECYPKPLVQGKLPPEQTIIWFLVMMNDLDVSMDYVKRIIGSRIDPAGELGGNFSLPSQAMHDAYPFNNDAVFVTNALHGLQTGFESKALELLNEGVQVVFKNVMGPRLRPVLNDSFRDIEYDLTGEELEELNRAAEENNELSLAADDAVIKRFQPGWGALTKPIARLLTDANFAKLLVTTIKYLATQLEKKIWSYYGRINSLGGVRLERDIANIIALVCGGGRYALRETFMRCTQICLFMNMETEEWEELVEAENQGDDGDWKLDAEERARAKAMVRS